jgi:hypothetical protein
MMIGEKLLNVGGVGVGDGGVGVGVTGVGVGVIGVGVGVSVGVRVGVAVAVAVAVAVVVAVAVGVVVAVAVAVGVVVAVAVGVAVGVRVGVAVAVAVAVGLTVGVAVAVAVGVGLEVITVPEVGLGCTNTAKSTALLSVSLPTGLLAIELVFCIGAAAAAVSKQVPLPYATLSTRVVSVGQEVVRRLVDLTKITLPSVTDKLTAGEAMKLGVGRACPFVVGFVV